MILTCKNVCKEFVTNKVLDNINFQLNSGDKVAIVGVNGAGKTTLFRIITKEIEADSGQVITPNNCKLGYLSQNTVLNSEKSIYEEMLTTKQYLIDMENKLRHFETQMSKFPAGSEELNNLMKSYSVLQHTFEEKNGYGYKSYITGILKGLGFHESEFDKQISLLSGGQKTRVALTKILIEEPDILLLDEPTNHLDIKATEWLEGFLSNYSGTLIVISHDRYFLDKIVSKVIEIENTHSHIYNGNYSFYIKYKNINKDIQLKHYENQQKEISRQEEVIKQLRSFNREKSIKRARSREKALEKVELIDKPIFLNDEMNISLQPKVISGNDVLTIENVSKSFGEKHLFTNVDLHITRGEHVALIGDNGTGKTTLFRMITGDITQDGGIIDIGSKVKIGYYDQEHQSLNQNNNLIEELSDAYPTMKVGDIRNTLAAFLFTGDDVFKKISSLSGGEKGRLSLAKLMLSEANFLLLDEPTNHLDMISKEILEKTLSNYSGTVLFISHDRYFINKIATKVVELNELAFHNYLGNYDYFLQKKAEKLKEEQEMLIAIGTKETKEITDTKENWLKEKEKQANLRKVQNRIKELEEEIHNIETDITCIDEKLCLEEIYTDHEKANALHNEKTSLENKLESFYEEWHELLEKLE